MINDITTVFSLMAEINLKIWIGLIGFAMLVAVCETISGSNDL